MAATPADVHSVGTVNGTDEFASVPDGEIQALIDEVTPQYGGRVADHPQHDAAITLHVAHLLHLMITASGAGGGQLGNLFPTTSRNLAGVGSRSKGGSFGQWGGDGTDPMKIPSRYLWRLTQIRKTMMPSAMTTGDSGSPSTAALLAVYGGWPILG